MCEQPAISDANWPPLRAYQLDVLERWRMLPNPKRLFLAWDMGAGKTLGALCLAHVSQPARVLIVCPAIVRPVWLRAATKHLPDHTVAVIEHGSTRKLSKVQTAVRERAYAATCQIVSYDLLPHIPPAGWDFIILDEFHALRSPSSRQSQTVRKLFRYNTAAMAVGLSGTPIPNEAKQLWNPVDTFFPHRWGKQTRIGFEPYSFCKRYCHKETSEYGTNFRGLREEMRPELAERFAEISHRVTQSEFAQFLPPLFVEPLELNARVNIANIVRGWLNNIDRDVPHIGIYTHRRDTASVIAHIMRKSSLREVFFLTGEDSPAARAEMLAQAQQCSHSVIVATTHALAEGVSLSFQKAALIIEWTSDVAAIVQFLGRFARQDSANLAPTRVSVAMGPNDVSAAETVAMRIDAINGVMRASRVSELAGKTFAPTEMSEDAFAEQVQSIAQSLDRRARLWGAEEDDDDE